jgi:hypothetical protein
MTIKQNGTKRQNYGGSEKIICPGLEGKMHRYLVKKKVTNEIG